MAKSSGSSESSGSKGESGKTNWLAILRVYLGAYFLHASIGKFTTSYLGEFSRTLSRWAHDSSFDAYRLFLNHWVVPHAKFFAYFTAIGEFYVGVALIIGFLSGLAAMFGIFFYGNYYLGSGGGDEVWILGLVIVCLFTVLFTGAGRIWGIDKHLSKKILFKYLV